MQNGCRHKDDGAPYGKDQDGEGWPSDFDCDDHNEAIFPNADEVPGDGIDQDCSGSDERGAGGEGGQSGGICQSNCGDGDAGGEPSTDDGIGRDEDQDGYTLASGDCDDADPFVHPGAFDAPADGLDQNCDGLDSADADGDGVDGLPDGADCDDTRAEVFPGAIEIVLNGLDENCDGSDLAGTEEARAILSSDAVVGEVPDMAVVELDGEPHWLVVWADSRVAVRQDIYAQLLTLDGQAVGEEIPVAVDTADAKAGVRIASAGDRALVVWSSAEGIFAQQLDAEGSLIGIPFGIADAGALDARPAAGGWTHEDGPSWAIAWRRPGDEPGTQAQLRTMSMEAEAIRSPIENIGDPQATVGAMAVIGTPSGFVAAWSGVLSEQTALWTQAYTRTGVATGAASTVHDEASGSLALGSNEKEVFLSFRTGGSLGHAAGLSLSLYGERPTDSDLRRLSSESPYQSDFRIAADTQRFFVAWDDDRHMSRVPAVQAVYGNLGVAQGQAHSSGQALYADEAADLGGVGVVENLSAIVIKVEDTARLLVLD
jgi:hypothetical protein